jgi:hypothetical protein
MVLTHEDAPLADQMPYLVHRLSPVPVTTFVGRAAKREPPVPVKDCLWWWFKDPASSTGSRAVPCNAFACARACSGAFRPPCMCCQKHRSSRSPTPHAHTPRPPFHSRMHCASSILRLAVLCLQMLHASPRPAVPIVPLLTFCHGNARARHDTPCTAHARRSYLVGFFFSCRSHIARTSASHTCWTLDTLRTPCFCSLNRTSDSTSATVSSRRRGFPWPCAAARGGAFRPPSRSRKAPS